MYRLREFSLQLLFFRTELKSIVIETAFADRHNFAPIVVNKLFEFIEVFVGIAISVELQTSRRMTAHSAVKHVISVGQLDRFLTVLKTAAGYQDLKGTMTLLILVIAKELYLFDATIERSFDHIRQVGDMFLRPVINSSEHRV